MLIKLKDIADVIAGYAFRGAIKPDISGDTFILQARNITQEDEIKHISDFTKISFNSLRTAAFLKKNDIVMTSRGMGPGSFRTTVVKFSDDNVLATSSVHIIRIKDSNVVPEYLSLYLDSTNGQNDIFMNVSGSYIKTILRKDLEDIEVPLPSIDKQKTIVALHENMRRQEEIINRKSEIRRNLYNATFRTGLIA